MVSLGNGAAKSVSDQIASLGSNLLIVMPGQRMGAGRAGASAPSFKIADVNAIQAQLTGLKAVAPTSSVSATVVSGPKNWTTSVTGSTNDHFTAGNWRFADGRMFTVTEQRAGKVACVVGDTVKKKLFGDLNPIGTDIRIKSISCGLCEHSKDECPESRM